MSDESSPRGAAPEGTPPDGHPKRMLKERTQFYADDVARRGLRYIVLPLVTVSLLGVVVMLSAPPIWHKIRERRGHAFAIQSLTKFRAGHLPEALKSLRSAITMAPNDPATLETTAIILSTEDLPDAISVWQTLFQKGGGTLAERLQYTALASRLGRFSLAITELNKILAVDPKNIDAKKLLVDISMRAGDFNTAINQGRELLSLGATPDRQFLLGTALVQSSKNAKTKDDLKPVEEGAFMLFQLATNSGPWQSQAAAALADHTQLVGEAAHQVLSALKKKTPFTALDLVTTTIIEIREEPTRAHEFMNQMAERMASAGLEDRLKAADWLASRQGLEAASKLIRPEDARTNHLAALLQLDFASSRRDWSFVKKELGNTNFLISPTIRACFEAGVAMSEGRAPTADALFRTAIASAGPDVAGDADLRYIALVAERTTNLLAAVSAHELRLKRSTSVLDASANILRLGAGGLPLERQFPALKARHDLMPEDVEIGSQYYYIAALLGRNLDEAKKGLSALRQAYPELPEPILGLAMIAVHSGAPADATNLLEEHPFDFEALPARLKVAYIHVIGRVGQKDLARSLARKLDINAYYPEERELLAPWLSR